MKNLTFYELDLGLNHVVRKYSEPLDDMASMLIAGELVHNHFLYHSHYILSPLFSPLQSLGVVMAPVVFLCVVRIILFTRISVTSPTFAVPFHDGRVILMMLSAA